MERVERILEQHTEDVCNVNERMVGDFASFNGIRIVNIFFEHKEIINTHRLQEEAEIQYTIF